MEKFTTDAEPEVRLMQAVIHQAVHDMRLQENARKNRAPNDPQDGEAEHWILSRSKRVGGFIWYCGLLGCRPDKMRKFVLDARDKSMPIQNMHAAEMKEGRAESNDWGRNFNSRFRNSEIRERKPKRSERCGTD